MSYHALSSPFHRFSVALSFVSVRCSVPEALAQQELRDVMVEEMKMLGKKKYMAVDLLRGKKMVSCKCVFTVMYKSN